MGMPPGGILQKSTLAAAAPHFSAFSVQAVRFKGIFGIKCNFYRHAVHERRVFRRNPSVRTGLKCGPRLDFRRFLHYMAR